VLGNHRPAAVAKASAFGMVSSSCSMPPRPWQVALPKGSGPGVLHGLLVASTNLVIELGIVMLICSAGSSQWVSFVVDRS